MTYRCPAGLVFFDAELLLIYRQINTQFLSVFSRKEKNCEKSILPIYQFYTSMSAKKYDYRYDYKRVGRSIRPSVANFAKMDVSPVREKTLRTYGHKD